MTNESNQGNGLRNAGRKEIHFDLKGRIQILTLQILLCGYNNDIHWAHPFNSSMNIIIYRNWHALIEPGRIQLVFIGKRMGAWEARLAR
jgi:hypothetical protein